MEKTAFILYLASVVIGVLLFGAGHTYAYTLTFLLVLLASLFQLKSVIRKNPLTGETQYHWIKTGMEPLFLLMTAFLIIQMLPLPQAVVKIISPEAWVMAQKSVPAQDAVGYPSIVPSWITLAPYTYPVRMALVRWFCYGLFFWGMVNSLNSRQRIDSAILVLVGIGCFEAVYGLIKPSTGLNYVWWWQNDYYGMWVTGTYINHNIFAGLMEMLLQLALGTAIGISFFTKKKKVTFGRQSLRGRFLGIIQKGEDANRRVLFFFAAVVISISLIFSGSRAGMAAAAVGLLAMGMLLLCRRGYRRKGGIILILFLIVGGWALKIGVEAPLKRFDSAEADWQVRARYTRDTITMWQDYRLTGAGGGSFHHVFNKYQSVEDRKGWIRYAHNDWAQLLSEYGIVGAAIGIGGLLYFLISYIRMWMRRRDSGAIGIGAGCLSGLVAIGAHSYFDFNLHYPANFLVMTSLLAIGLAAIRLSDRGGSEKSLFHKRLLPAERSGMIPTSIIILIVVWAGYWSICHFMGEVYCNTVPNLTLNRDPLPPIARIDTAISWDSDNGEYRFKKALAIIRDRDAAVRDLPTGWLLPSSARLSYQKKILAAVENAVALNPFMAEYHLRNGWEFTSLWQQPDYHRTYLPAADIAMERAAYTAGVKDPRFHVEMGKYWTMRSKTLDPSDPRWEPAWSRAGYHFKKALSMELQGGGGVGGGLPKMQQQALLLEIRNYIWAFYPDESFLEAAMGEYLARMAK
ncbi:MAG: O-antigen ligase family protein [Pseudomonadota bacterium]